MPSASADRECPEDPRGLIREAFRIEGVTPETCRSIFFDWALGLADDLDPRSAILRLVEIHARESDDHPMKRVLQEGLAAARRPGRRSGRRRPGMRPPASSGRDADPGG